MEKNRCPKCDKVLTLTDVEGGKRFICTCGSKSEIYPIVKGVHIIRRRKPWIMLKCPFCGNEHYHSAKPIPALRKGHCPGFGFDGKEGERLEKYLKKYPHAYKGRSYYVT